MLGTIVNSLAIILGSLLGVILGRFVHTRLSTTIMQAMGLCVVAIGIKGSLELTNILLVILSLALGSLMGELIGIEAGLNRLGEFVQKRVGKEQNDFSRGFVTSSLLFCVGAMAVIGSINSGMLGDHTILYAKALIDCVMSFIFASTMGIGVLFSSFIVFLYQGSIVLLSSFLKPIFDNPQALGDLTAVGSILITGVGINTLELTTLRIGNMLPALLGPIIYYGLLLGFNGQL